MQPTMELAELDELVAQLDTTITQVEVNDDKQAPSILLCSLDGCHPWSWYYC